MTLRSKIGLLLIIIGVVFLALNLIGAIGVVLVPQVDKVEFTDTFASVTNIAQVTNFGPLGFSMLVSAVAIVFGFILRKKP